MHSLAFRIQYAVVSQKIDIRQDQGLYSKKQVLIIITSGGFKIHSGQVAVYATKKFRH
jgi:hypothetical protein